MIKSMVTPPITWIVGCTGLPLGWFVHDVSRVILVEWIGSPTRSTLRAAMEMIRRCSEGKHCEHGAEIAAGRQGDGRRDAERLAAAAIENHRARAGSGAPPAPGFDRRPIGISPHSRTTPTGGESNSSGPCRNCPISKPSAGIRASSISISAAALRDAPNTPRPLMTIVVLSARRPSASSSGRSGQDAAGSRSHLARASPIADEHAGVQRKRDEEAACRGERHLRCRLRRPGKEASARACSTDRASSRTMLIVRTVLQQFDDLAGFDPIARRR